MANTMQAKDIVADVRKILVDNGVSAEFWTDSELLSYLNDGALAISLLKPDVSTVNTTMTMAAGPKQSAPSDAIRLLDVIRDTTSGRRVSFVDRTMLDAVDPDWYSRPNTGSAVHYTFDSRDPQTFYLYRNEYICHKMLSTDWWSAGFGGWSWNSTDKRWESSVENTGALNESFDDTDFRPERVKLTLEVQDDGGVDHQNFAIRVDDDDGNEIGRYDATTITNGTYHITIDLDFQGSDLSKLFFSSDSEELDYKIIHITNIAFCGDNLSKPPSSVPT